MSNLKYYYNLLSQPSRAIYVFMKITEIPFEGKSVNLLNGEHLTEQFETINPLKKVPVIDDKGFILTESVAILRYLCRTYNVADHWYPKDSIKQGRVDEYLEWQHLNTRANCAHYYLQKAIIPIMHKKPVDENKIAIIEKRMNDTLDKLENIWLKDKTFLSGNEISISDIIGICEIEQPVLVGYDPYVGRSKLFNWKMRVTSYLNPYLEEVNETAIKFNKNIGKLNSKL